MYLELLFASLVVLTTVYMCHMINEGPGNFGYQRFHMNDDYADSTSESEFNAFHSGSPAHSVRSSRWSSTTFSSDDSDGDHEQDLIFMDTPTQESDTRKRTEQAGSSNSNLPHGNHPAAAAVESEITAIETEPLDSPVYNLLVTQPRDADHAEVPWIINPLFQEAAS